MQINTLNTFLLCIPMHPPDFGLYGGHRVVRGTPGCTGGHRVVRGGTGLYGGAPGCTEVILYGGAGLHGGYQRLHTITHDRVISSKYNCVGVVPDLYCDKTSLLGLLVLHTFLRFQKKEKIT